MSGLAFDADLLPIDVYIDEPIALGLKLETGPDVPTPPAKPAPWLWKPTRPPAQMMSDIVAFLQAEQRLDALYDEVLQRGRAA